MNLYDVNLPHVIDVVETVMNGALKIDVTRTGGYFCFAGHDGMPIFILKVGELPDISKAEKYLLNAQEKCRRLATTGGTLASETRDISVGKYAGAVAGTSYIYAFSGLPEFLDEAAMLLVAASDFDIEPDDVASLAKQSGNTYFNDLKKLLEKN